MPIIRDLNLHYLTFYLIQYFVTYSRGVCGLRPCFVVLVLGRHVNPTFSSDIFGERLQLHLSAGCSYIYLSNGLSHALTYQLQPLPHRYLSLCSPPTTGESRTSTSLIPGWRHLRSTLHLTSLTLR